MIVVSLKGNDNFSSDDTFPASFWNMFINYPLAEIRVGNKSWTNRDKAPLQRQLNFVVFCTLSACGVSSEHLNYKKHPMVRLLYQFHIYYHMRKILHLLLIKCIKAALTSKMLDP